MKTRNIALALLFISASVIADPVFEVTANSTRACLLGQPSVCNEFQRGYRFEATNWQGHAAVIGGKTLTKEGQKGEAEYYQFNSADVAALRDGNGNYVEPACKWPTGGEVDRMVIGKNGQLFLKRWMIITECHNGKMVSRQRPLN